MTANPAFDAPFHRLDVLVADDNAAMRGTLRAMLAAFGCARVREARDAEQALHALRAEPADIVILDWKMGAVDGVELARRLRAGAAGHPRPAVVMLTAYAGEERARAARAAGVDVFLTKPVSAEALCEGVLAAASASVC